MTDKTLPFSSATRDHVEDILRLDLTQMNSHVYMLTLPHHCRVGMLSDAFEDVMKYLIFEPSLDREAGLSDVIKAFVREANRIFPTELRLVPEVRLSWEERGSTFNGVMDIAVTDQRMKSIILLGEVKKMWTMNGGLYELLAEAGCILRIRENAGKRTPVLSIRSNAFNFQFFAIDERNGSVYSSKTISLDLLRIADFKSDPQVIEVVSWLVWFIQITVSVSPTSLTREHPTDEEVSKLQELRRCFRPAT